MFNSNVNQERYVMTPKNLDKAFSVNANSNPLANSTVNFKGNLNLQVINENTSQKNRIVLDDVIT